MNTIQKFLALLLLASLVACAHGRAKTCSELAGAGWTPQAKAPANANDLLSLENLPGGSEVTWYSNGPDRELACFYATGLNNPSCGGTTAYEFGVKDGHWVSRSLRSEVCPVENDT